MIYCDTSLIVAALTFEARSEQARDWLTAHIGEPLAASPWVNTEVASALAMKQRRSVLSATKRRDVEQARQRLRSDAFQILSIDERHFVIAVRLVDTGRGLRAGDALHLAIALDHGCDFATFDRDLAEAAIAEGLTVHG